MIAGNGRWALLGVGLALALARLQAADFFVAPGGTSFGPGTLAGPYDLATALSGQVGQPGDTFWLCGGDYKLGHFDTDAQGAPGRPLTFRQVHGEHARIDGSISVFNTQGYLVFRDLEFYSSDTNRLSSQVGVGFKVTDITILPGISCYAPNLSLINLVVHDQTRHGIYADTSTNILVYGCIVYNNGWRSPDNAEGHGLYVQGDLGTRSVVDNVVFNNSGINMHIYENANGGVLRGILAEGNVAFNAGAIQDVRNYRDWLVGVDLPAAYADNIILRNNLGYQAPGPANGREVQIGRDSTNGTVVLTGNYLPLGLVMNNWSNATVSGNLFNSTFTNYTIALNQTLTPLSADWNRNTYVCDPAGRAAMLDFQPYTFTGWQSTTGYDQDSAFLVGRLQGGRVFVRPNLYEKGRATIVVYNWDNLDKVVVDVRSVLPVGARFEVRNIEDYFAPPVLSGIFDGGLLQLPMTNLTVALPSGPMLAPAPTGPTFNVFLLSSTGDKLRIARMNGAIQVCWPVSAGANALQFADSLSNSGGWTQVTNTPVTTGDEFMLTDSVSAGTRFYRLQIP